MGIVCQDVSVLQDKDGITVARVVSDEKSYVVKYFQKDEYKRNIENYRLLETLGVPTIQVIASTDSAILLEDIACSSAFRLGDREDMSDLGVSRQIAAWYKQLHNHGYAYACQRGASMCDEADFFTVENIAER